MRNKIQFSMQSFWEVFLKARLLKFYATTKFPAEEGLVHYARGEGMVDALKIVFGVDFCEEVEKAVTLDFASRRIKQYPATVFDEQRDKDRVALADLMMEVQARAKQYAQDYERVKATMIQSFMEEIRRTVEEPPKRTDREVGQGLNVTIPSPKDPEEED